MCRPIICWFWHQPARGGGQGVVRWSSPGLSCWFWCSRNSLRFPPNQTTGTVWRWAVYPSLAKVIPCINMYLFLQQKQYLEQQEKSLSALSPAVLALGGAGVCMVRCARMLRGALFSASRHELYSRGLPCTKFWLELKFVLGGDVCWPQPVGSLLGAGPVSLVHQAAASSRGNLELKLQPLCVI